MKDYREVVRDRYDGELDAVHPYSNQYYSLNPVGYAASTAIRRVVYRMFAAIRREGRDVTAMRILDVGCGRGSLTRLFLEIALHPQNVHGIDLSSARIEGSRLMNPSVSYECADILQTPTVPVRYDLVTAFDVFMHFATGEQIQAALANVRSILAADGYFAWYDVVCRDHFRARPGAEASGFSRRQMEEFCRGAGFRKVAEFRAFRTILGRTHSLYLRGRFPEWLVRATEIAAPGAPGNVLMLFRRDG
jgi:cyclopropane fatty-acyl-phospholipid synthase-like methyltransferase